MKVIAHGPSHNTGYGPQPTIHVSLTLIEFNLLVHGLRSYRELKAENAADRLMGPNTIAPASCPHTQAPDPRPEIGTEYTLKAEHLSDAIDSMDHATRILRTFTTMAPPETPKPETHVIDALVNQAANPDQMLAAFQDVLDHGTGTVEVSMVRTPGEPIDLEPSVRLRHVPFKDTLAPAPEPAPTPEDEKKLARWAASRARYSRTPLAGLEKGSPKYKAVLSAIRKQQAARRKRNG